VPLLGTSYSSIACSCPWVRSAPAAQHLHTPPASASHRAHARATCLVPPTFLPLQRLHRLSSTRAPALPNSCRSSSHSAPPRTCCSTRAPASAAPSPAPYVRAPAELPVHAVSSCPRDCSIRPPASAPAPPCLLPQPPVCAMPQPPVLALLPHVHARRALTPSAASSPAPHIHASHPPLGPLCSPDPERPHRQRLPHRASASLLGRAAALRLDPHRAPPWLGACRAHPPAPRLGP
jgi:hypothetical protein